MAVYTWGGATDSNFDNPANWSSPPPVPGYPQPTDTIIFTGASNNPCTVSANRSVQGITFSGAYTAALTLTGNLTVGISGLALSATNTNILGSGNLILGSTCTIQSLGGTFTGNLQIGSAAAIVVTLITGFTVTRTLTFTSTVSLTGAFFITALGDVVASTNCIVSTTNSNSTTLVLAGATTKWSGAGRLGCNITFNSASSNFIIEGNVVFGSIVTGSASPQLNYTSGASTTTASSTLTLVGSVQLSVQNIVFNNVNFGTLAQGQLYTISLIQDLFIGGNLLVGFGGAGQHQISRSATQRVFVRGNFQVGTSNIINNSINGAAPNGAEIVMEGNATSTSIMSSFLNGAPAQTRCWCNVDLTINAGANSVALDTTNEFNFGNPVASAVNPRRFKYTSGNFISTGSTINLANSILDLDNAQLVRFNNVRIYPFGVTTNVQLQKNTTINGNLITGFAGAGGGLAALTLPSGGTATTLTIQGGLLLGGTTFTFQNLNRLESTVISLNFVGSGTIQGRAMANININLNSGNYTIVDFYFGNTAFVPTFVPTLKYNGGTILCTGSLFTANCKLDLGAVELNNLSPTLAAPSSGSAGYTITLVASNILRVNGNLTTGLHWNNTPSSGQGFTTINADTTTLNAQIDVYGDINMSSNLVNLTGTTGTSRLYMKGTGTFTTNNIAFCGMDVFLQGTVTLGSIWMGLGKRLEYISGTLTTTNSLTTINNSSSATIKTLGQTWGDIAIRGSATLIADGSITCRDLITYNDSGVTSIQGAGFILTIKRNLTIGANSLLGTTVNPIDKLVMDATNSGTGTWTSGGGQLRISLDLNAPTRTIAIPSSVSFGNATTQRLRWFATTIMNATGSTLTTGSATLDLGNQLWGGLTTGQNASVNFESNASFTDVNLTGGGTATYLNGITTARNLTVRGNFAISQNTGTFTGFNLVDIIFDGNGTWSNGVGFTLNENIILASGTRTLSGNVNWGGSGLLGIGGAKTFSATGGTLNGGTSTYNIIGSNTITVNKFTRGTFNNVTTTANATITLNAQMGILGTLTLSNTALNTTTFASSSNFGWDAFNFTHGGGNSTCILNAGSTYNISGTFQLLGNNDGSRATLRSSKLSTFATATANGTTLTSTPSGGSAVEVGMVLSQASVVASDGFAAIYPNRPILTSAVGSPYTLDAAFPVNPSTGPIAMEAGVKANLNLAVSTGVPLILFATVKDINSIGGQTIYAFQTYLDAPSNPQANMFRTINWNTLAPPVSPIGIGYLSVT
jgi:hypothetical protein